MGRLLLLGGLATFLSGCASKFRPYNGPDVTRLRMYKAQRLLFLNGAVGVFRTYPIGLDFAPEATSSSRVTDAAQKQGVPERGERTRVSPLQRGSDVLSPH